MKLRVKDTGPIALALPCFPGSQSASWCLWSRTAPPPPTQPLGPGCPCDHGRPVWSTGRLGTRQQCWAGPQTGGPLVLSPHHSLKLCTKIKDGKLSKTLPTQVQARQLSWVMIRVLSNLSTLPFDFVDILVLSKQWGQYLGHCSYYDSHAILNDSRGPLVSEFFMSMYPYMWSGCCQPSWTCTR